MYTSFVKKINKYFVIQLIVFLLLTSCGRLPRAKGPEDGIYAFKSSTLDSTVIKNFNYVFRHVIMTPPPQPVYQVFWNDETDFPDFTLFKNLIIVADLNDRGVAKKLCEKLLPGEQYDLASSDSINIFIKHDLWAEGQTVTIVAGTNPEIISAAILSNENWIFSEYEKAFAYRYRHFVMAKYEQKGISKHLQETYGWSFPVQYEYMIGDELPDENFVRLLRGYPVRWVSVYWEEGYHPEWLTVDGLKEIRDKVGKKFYDNIYTDNRFRKFNYVKLGGNTALRLRGLWAKEDEAKGGPFIAYTTYDKDTDRTFFIDILLFGPGEKLTIVLRQTDLMVNGFRTYPEYEKADK